MGSNFLEILAVQPCEIQSAVSNFGLCISYVLLQDIHGALGICWGSTSETTQGYTHNTCNSAAAPRAKRSYAAAPCCHLPCRCNLGLTRQG